VTSPAGEAARAGAARRLVLVVEHDPGVAELERAYLTRAGYDVIVVAEPAVAAETAGRLRPAAVVLDLSVHAFGNLYAEVSTVAGPIVCLTRADQARHPEAPGLVRPFSPRALVAEVAGVLRPHEPPPPGAAAPPGVLRAGGIVADVAVRGVLADGGAVPLTAIEFDLLAFLMNHAGRVCTREQLLAGVWGPVPSAGARTVDVHIAQLRAKLGAMSPIRTVRGIGYTIDP
jgi:DNA-binding response OmpR family regulator